MIWLHASLVTKSSQDFVLPQWINQLNFSCSYFKLLFFFGKILESSSKAPSCRILWSFSRNCLLQSSSCKILPSKKLLQIFLSSKPPLGGKFFFPNLLLQIFLSSKPSLGKKILASKPLLANFFLSSKPPLANFSFFQISLKKSMRVFNLAMISWVS